MIDCSKCIHYEVCANRYANDGCEGSCGYYLQDIRPQGKWLESDVPESTLAKCSICGFDCGAKTHNFCSNCGAGMWKGGAE